ncbi:L-aspartate oxidase [Lacticaseibacillus jixiensis]|uniref:L-aspartate oxidase n=1 Tax=Lacticaseibacillus jixiensis TaxID=3231926 RepID=UPI0036F2CE3A
MKRVVIIGGGLAGCYLASRLQDNCDVTIVTKGGKADSNSMLAQGGIAAALDPGDSPKVHEEDTLKAGVFHNRTDAVEQLVTTGPKLVQDLIDKGMAFDRNPDGTLNFGLEGAHSFHRVLHANGDRTGAAVTSFVQSLLHNVTWQEHTAAVALQQDGGRCTGVVVRNVQDDTQQSLTADAVVLASGGLGNLYTLTTNDHTVTGDGIALAARAGVKLHDMAFVQFHPTLLTIDHRCFGLITEAIRGAGAILVDENSAPIMVNVPHKDLAPRDVVARHLTAAMAAGHHVFLDISRVADFAKHFPGVAENLDNHDIPWRRTMRIPVQPGAHFMMGGVDTDLNAQTSLEGLWAVGEVACNGVHGANRLASNSLLDCLVSADKAALSIQAAPAHQQAAPQAATPQYQPAHLPALSDLQQHAWAMLGVERTKQGMQDFLTWLSQYDVDQPAQTVATKDLPCLNLALCSQLIAEAALQEPRSLGAHYLKEA